jgi:hypothetical protein
METGADSAASFRAFTALSDPMRSVDGDGIARMFTVIRSTRMPFRT